MKVVLIAQKEEFDEKRVKQIKKYASVQWIDQDTTDILSVPELGDTDDKVLALSPVPIGWSIPKELYSRLNNVKYLSLVTTSSEFLDMEKLSKKRIKVTNVPHYATNAVAEQVILSMLSITKRIPAQIKSDYKYEFSNAVLGSDLYGKKLGIIGLGDIGSRVADMGQGLGMQVSYWSKCTRNERYVYKSLNKLLRESDVIVPLVDSNKKTEEMLDQKRLANIRDSAYVISMIDEKVWDKDYMLKRTEQGALAGLAYESSIDKLPNVKGNVMVLPQLAWYTEETLENNIQLWADTIISCVEGMPQNVISG